MTENQNVEWKENWRDEYIKWICGFANAQGGKLIIGVNDKGVAAGLSKPNNPDIANAFFRAGLIEAWGRGIQKIASECEIVGLPAPEYRYDFSGFILEFNLISQNIPDETSEKTSEKILEAITSNNQITISELAETIGLTTRSIERNIKKLQQEGKLERIGSFKGGHWKIIRG
jgi:ATP-dependent DNA helicase RecG